MRLSLSIFAAYLATIAVALPTTPTETGTLDTSNPNAKLVFSSGVGKEAKREQCDGNPTNLQSWQNKRCDITDLECWQHHYGDFERSERRGKAAGPVYGIPEALDQYSVNVEEGKA